MRRSLLCLAGFLVVGGVCLAASMVGGEECRLTLKRLGSRSLYSPADYQIRSTYPQTLFTQFLSPSIAGRVRVEVGGREDQAAAFKRVVKKEPAKYECPYPFRGVAKLGGQEFAFVFDAVGAKPEEKAKEDAEKKAAEAKKAKSKPKSSLLEALSRAVAGQEAGYEGPGPRGRAISYNRLYFDLNHNGDLTDDKVIEAQGSGDMGYAPAAAYARGQFPEITVTLEAGGTKYDYSFTMYVTYQAMDDRSGYAWASLNAASYREGAITLEGKKRRVVLVDFNSNGRFDDPIKLREVTVMRGRSPQAEVSPEYGDVLLLDPQAQMPVYVNPYDVTSAGNRYYVSKLVNIDGKYFDLAISPAGDKLSLKAAAPALGHVTNPNESFNAVVYGDQGFLKIHGEKSKPVPLPVGSWKLLSYTIERTAAAEVKKPAGEKKKPAAGAASKEKQGTLLEALLKAMSSSAPSSAPVGPLRMTRVSAQATLDYKPVAVRKGETVVLPFGPPYKPVVRVEYPQGPGQVRLGMTLFGSAGERCTDMMVQGNRPAKPAFTVSNPKGEIVYRGNFDYG